MHPTTAVTESGQRRTGLRVALPLLAALLTGACRPGADEAEAEQQRQALAGLQARADASLEGRTVLLGSSTLARWPAALGLPATVNLGLPGDTLPSLVQRTRGYRGLAQAERLVINIGLNDLRKRCKAETADLAPLLQALPPDVPVSWFGIQGVAPSVRAGWCDGRFAELSRQFNRIAEQACQTRPGCRFVRHPVAEDVDTATSLQWHVADGIHLSAIGYGALAAALQDAHLPAPIQARR